MDYALDHIGAVAFQFLLSELVLERTTHRVEVVDSMPLRVPAERAAVNLRWPPDLDGDLWSGFVLIDTLYVPAGKQRGWTAQRLATHVEDRLKHEAAARAIEHKQQEAEAKLAAKTEQPVPMSVRRTDGPQSAPPDYLVFATNLSFATLGGDVDETVDDALRSLGRPLGLLRWKVWDHAALCRMLDGAPKTRRRYLAELTPNDVLNRLVEYDVGVSARLQEVIAREITTGLDVDQFIRLSRAGRSEREQLMLHAVAVDLPVNNETWTAARLIIESADARSFLRKPERTENLLLLGGPGQGKSTIAQLLTQCYRVALLDGAIGPEHPAYALAADVRHGIAEANIPLPRFRRWPIRVGLARYVDAATNARQTSLIGHVADLVNKLAPGVTGAQVRAWLRAWPWMLILDGFDEVASVEGRDTVMEQLSAFMGEVQALGADVIVVATSRPQGYAGEFTHQGYRHYELAPLEIGRAIEYGTKLAVARHGRDKGMRESVVERLTRAADDRRTARLMRSPLQITIMSILLENRERVPRARYELFEAYYDAIYTRESDKPGPLGELLEKRRNDVNELHNWLGLLLQVNAERAGGLDASIPAEDLRLHAVRRLEKEGHERHEAGQLADQLITAVTSRLVLIVPTKRVDVGFEVRSIQEFFAARAIVSGADDGVLEQLGRIIEPVHWRNTWLFAAGKVFVEREHLRDDLVGLLRSIDDRDLLRVVVAPGADLALDLVEDDVATTSPGLQRSLYRQALELLKYPPDNDLDRRCAVLFQIADADPVAALLLEQALDAAVAGGPARFSAAYTVLKLAQRGATPLALRFRPRLRAAERAVRSGEMPVADVASTVSAAFAEVLAAAQPPRADRDLLDEFLARFLDGSTEPDSPRKGRDEVGQDAVRMELLDRCLTREPIADVVAKATLAAGQRDARAGAVLRDVLRSWLQRRAAGAPIVDR